MTTGFLYTMVKLGCSAIPKFTSDPKVAQDHQRDGWIIFAKGIGIKKFGSNKNVFKPDVDIIK